MGILDRLKGIFSSTEDYSPTYNPVGADIITKFKKEINNYKYGNNYDLGDLDLIIKALKAKDPYKEDLQILDRSPDIMLQYPSGLSSSKSALEIADRSNNQAGRELESNGVISENSKHIVHYIMHGSDGGDKLDTLISALETNDGEYKNIRIILTDTQSALEKLSKQERPTTSELKSLCDLIDALDTAIIANSLYEIACDIDPKEKAVHYNIHQKAQEFIESDLIGNLPNFAQGLLDRLPAEKPKSIKVAAESDNNHFTQS